MSSTNSEIPKSKPWSSKKAWALFITIAGICAVALLTTTLGIPERIADKAIDAIAIIGAGAIGVQWHLDREAK